MFRSNDRHIPTKTVRVIYKELQNRSSLRQLAATMDAADNRKKNWHQHRRQLRSCGIFDSKNIHIHHLVTTYVPPSGMYSIMSNTIPPIPKTLLSQ